MRMINPDSLRLNVALAGGLRTFKHWNGVRILVVVPQLLTVMLWVSVQQVGQTQGAVPAQPTGLTAAAGDGQATLTWDEPSDSSITGSEYLQAQAAKLTASDGVVFDNFVYSVAVDGDTVVVGAWGDDDNGSESGSAYVFTKPATGWATDTETAKLTASDGAADDWFGRSVAVDGDTVMVGTTEDDDNGSSSGSAYVFIKPATGWATANETGQLTAPDGAFDDRFGSSAGQSAVSANPANSLGDRLPSALWGLSPFEYLRQDSTFSSAFSRDRNQFPFMHPRRKRPLNASELLDEGVVRRLPGGSESNSSQSSSATLLGGQTRGKAPALKAGAPRQIHLFTSRLLNQATTPSVM